MTVDLKRVSHGGISADFNEKTALGDVWITDGTVAIKASMTLLKLVLAEVVLCQKKAELDASDCNALLGIKRYGS